MLAGERVGFENKQMPGECAKKNINQLSSEGISEINESLLSYIIYTRLQD